MLRLEYFSDIPRTSGRTPDVQLRAIDATLCIIGHLAPNLGECPDVFLFCYNSNISLISCGCLVGLRTSDSAQWPRHFCIIGQLVPNSAKRSNGFPFCYDSDISLIYCGCPSDSRCPTLHNGRGVFVLSDNSHPTQPSVPMFFLS